MGNNNNKSLNYLEVEAIPVIIVKESQLVIVTVMKH
jgi:hypothetical protein